MKQKNLLFRIFLVIFLVAVAGIIGLLVRDHIQKDKDRKLREKAAVSVQEEPEVSAEAEETPVQIPVGIREWKDLYRMCAWYCCMQKLYQSTVCVPAGSIK